MKAHTNPSFEGLTYSHFMIEQSKTKTPEKLHIPRLSVNVRKDRFLEV